jgi:hemoglobin
MAAAVERVCAATDADPSVAEELMAYFVPTAEHLRNDTGLPISTSRPITPR